MINPFSENTYGVLKNYIGGQFLQAKETMPVYEPATGQLYNQIPCSQSKETLLAIDAAAKAFANWSALTVKERSAWLHKLASAIEQNLQKFALAESIDSGKPLSLARNIEIPRSILNLRFFADLVLSQEQEHYQTDPLTSNLIIRQPLGVVAAISPWNLPLYLLTWKIAPALATGNCVVAKPSEITPLTAHLLAEVAQQIEFPSGVLNILHGPGTAIGQSLCTDPRVKAITFTGSTKTGRILNELAAPYFKKLALEMGGKNPSIVFADCNFELSVKEVLRAAFQNQGQICLCGSRILIEKSIYEKFKNALVRAAKELICGDPLDESTQFAALSSSQHFEKISYHFELAKTEGAKILCGGESFSPNSRCKEGWFFKPTLLEGLSNQSKTNQEEIFGPIACLIPFSTEAEAIQIANESSYGLAANVWTQDSAKSERLAAALEFGIVWINTWMNRDLRTPFGGMKNSGLGREGGTEALHFMTEAKTVCSKKDLS